MNLWSLMARLGGMSMTVEQRRLQTELAAQMKMFDQMLWWIGTEISRSCSYQHLTSVSQEKADVSIISQFSLYWSRSWVTPGSGREARGVWRIPILELQGCHLSPNSILLFFCLILMLFQSCHFSANGPFFWCFNQKTSCLKFLRRPAGHH